MAGAAGRGGTGAAADSGGGGEPAAVPAFARRRSKVKKSEGLWLMSFSDMSLILMSFFVLQLSFSTLDKKKFDNLNSAMQQAKVDAATPAAAAVVGGKTVENLQTLTNKVTALVHAAGLEKAVEVSYGIDGVAIEFKDGLLFDAGSADPSPRHAPVVDQVMQAIAKTPGGYHMVFEGHTDDVPVRSGKYRSNWELSAARGISLLAGFQARGVAEKRMSVVSFAHTRPKVAVRGLKGEALKNARAANRRVVIRIE